MHAYKKCKHINCSYKYENKLQFCCLYCVVKIFMDEWRIGFMPWILGHKIYIILDCIMWPFCILLNTKFIDLDPEVRAMLQQMDENADDALSLELQQAIYLSTMSKEFYIIKAEVICLMLKRNYVEN